MLTQMNVRMKRLLESKDVMGCLNQELDPHLKSLVDARFVESRGCFFLEPFLREGIADGIAVNGNRADLECSVNTVCVPAMLDKGKTWNSYEVFVQGYKYALEVARRLKSQGHFKVLLCFRTWEDCPECQVQFYRIRPHNEWFAPEIDGYKLRAVMAIETLGD